jgi:dTDP-4-dehydrorhamnose 3,5-epimerase
MHYQIAPHAEAKLVRCTAGAIYDVIIDLRASSPTFRKWLAVELSAEHRNMLYIPEGFAHGFPDAGRQHGASVPAFCLFQPGKRAGAAV